ncbi:phage major capsid protein [Acidipropionibacterium jensenii]|uniref:phage major capsid protein n=1 Tax=Acidipropionibacterium jensenii TaxID=1749 RepID=UPI00110AF774|nr:phage major capsid protein [Acidipropionibacterium jensenii]QCV87060.1 phage major capsid protein [Acidipropionibacterium jensenii]
MATVTTTTTNRAWSPDVQAFLPDQAIPQALILAASTAVYQGDIGDAPACRVPYVVDDDAEVTAEGADIPEADPQTAEVVIHTEKISQLIKLSREQFQQSPTAELLSTSVGRAIVKRADVEFLAGAHTNLPGISTTEGIVDGGAVGTNLDTISDAIAQIQQNGGEPTSILISPLGWSALRKLKASADSNLSVIGAGTNDAQNLLFGVPVTVTAALAATKLLVVDKTSIASVVGPVNIAQSTERYFEADAIGIRATWRIGWAVQRPNRLATLTIG